MHSSCTQGMSRTKLALSWTIQSGGAGKYENSICCRSLHISDELMIPFRIAGLTELTALTKLWFADEFGCAAYLRNLSSLKDLAYNVPQYEDIAIVSSEEAVLTRLVILGITVTPSLTNSPQ